MRGQKKGKALKHLRNNDATFSVSNSESDRDKKTYAMFESGRETDEKTTVSGMG